MAPAAPLMRAPRIARLSEVRLADTDDDSAELVRLLLPEPRPPARMPVSSGDVLAGRYVIDEKVGDSGMGMVYRALDRRREEAGSPFPWVALKFARATDPHGSSTSDHLRREFLNLSQLSHPNIVSVFDFDTDGGLAFVVMEWLEGETLADLLGRITSKRIALEKAEEVVRCVAGGLAHAHDLGIVHGDVKPSNIFLTKSRAVKLLDFGSSGPADAEANRGSDGNWATRAYASPELLRGGAPRSSDDVFALGVTAYYLLSGERPFCELDPAEAQERGLLPLPLPQDSQERWPAIEHALKFAAVERPADAREFLREFDEPPGEAGAPPAITAATRVAYGAIAVGLLLALVAWTVGSIGGLPADLEEMLDSGQQALEEGKLVQPADANAFQYFSSVLARVPDHPQAHDGLRTIAETYLTLSRQALSEGDARAAVDNLDIARRVMPGHYAIGVTGDLISRYGKDLLQNARGIAATDPAEAEALLIRASKVLDEDNAEVAAVRAELGRLGQERELLSLLSRIDERILAERLTVPPGDSAVDLLGQARALAPDDRQVVLAADRIATALLFQAMFAISGRQLDDAAGFIQAAKALDVRHIALARAEYELAKARHEALIAQRSAED